MNKFKIYQFDPVIYPRKLWVACDGTVKDLNDSFADIDDENSPLNESSFKNAIASTTSNLRSRKSGAYGVLVWMPDKSKVDVATVAHEAVHAATGILRDIGIQFDFDMEDEYLAYLVGFCADCINQVRTGKIKD